MRLLMLGINHRTAPVALREALALTPAEQATLLTDLRQQYPQAEAVVLCTCNRVELYVARPTHEHPRADDLRRLLAEHCGVAIEQLGEQTVMRMEQEQAAKHLFRVGCGLDSLVLGEPQVLGQIKRAYEAAVASQAVGPVLHKLFQHAIATAKRVRTASGIGEGRVSVGSVAVDFARQVFEDFTDKTVVGLGAGEMAKATLRHLLNQSPGKLWLTSRTLASAQTLAASLHLTADRGGARPWEDLDMMLTEADVIIASTGSRDPVLTMDRFRPVLKRRRHRPLFIIDIAVPRDIDSAIGELDDVYLYNIDDLTAVVAENVEQRREQIDACEAQLVDAVSTCMEQLEHRDVGRLIRQLRHRLHEVGEGEQERTRRKFAAIVGPAQSEALEALLDEHTRRLINKILHMPLSQLHDPEREVAMGFYAAALQRLFDLDEEAAPPAQDAKTPDGSTINTKA
ncbi:glutamyl-tRNA reductase [Phycisphaerales bacterium AB-hyl4]|uniref:Glutamyl-tRNA reductase n=1 Tax=Natronomicrosphaera hydrolytica TaxID=3242702 RepID=A0ABV4U640_9BACT